MVWGGLRYFDGAVLMDVPKHVLDTPKTVALFLSCFCFKFYRLPTAHCENDTIRHVLFSFKFQRLPT